MKNDLEVGDVITSKKFTDAYQNPDEEYIRIWGDGSQFILKQESIKMCDPTRGEAKFVVTKANVDGASEQTEEDYPHYVVIAQRLNEDGSYNHDGEIIYFVTLGSVYGVIDQESIEIVGSMKKIITFEKIEKVHELPLSSSKTNEKTNS